MAKPPDFEAEEPTVTVPVETLAETMATIATSERPTVRMRRITPEGSFQFGVDKKPTEA